MKKDTTMKLKTAEQARADLAHKGVAICAWARAHNLKIWAVRDVLRGHHQMMRGDGHKAAVLLGMKEGELYDLPTVPDYSTRRST
jgi:gp16 family phage-associated protein